MEVFPPWTTKLRPLLGIAAVGGLVYLVTLVWYGASPKTTDVGYMPEQPQPFSHAIHAGDLQLDCRYCHNTVEEAGHAAIPPPATCMNCHARIRTESPKLANVRASYATGEPLAWTRVHDLADFAYFDHSAHVTRGVGCVSCHGRIDTMEEVYQENTLSMGWCLECHRDPEPNLRPPEFATSMVWKPEGGDARAVGARVRAEYHLNPSQDCSTCHR